MKIRWFGIAATAATAFLFTSYASAATYTPPSAAVSKMKSYRGYSELTSAASGMDIDLYTYNMTTWQIDNGGFYKAMADSYKSAYSSGNKSSWRSASGGDLGTIDNNATIQEMRLLAVRYKETTNSTYKAAFKTSFNKAMDFLFTMQRPNGGFPQVWPKRGNYSDQITLNDNAMIRVMVTMMDIANKTDPFDSDIIDETTRAKMESSLDKAVDFLIRAQIVNGSSPTVWCAQHDTSTMVPVGARAYELPSKSGSESAGAVWFLMNWSKQTPAVQNAVKSAIAWYKKNKVSDLKFSSGNFVTSSGASMWYRFYEVNTDDYFFCDRDGESTKTQDITQISDERRTGYQWAGDYGSALLSAESAYLSAIDGISIAEIYGPNAGSAASSSSAVSSSSETPASSSSVEVVVTCGSTACATILEGESYLNIDGVSESKNAGFSGEGYANATNASGSTVSYGVTAAVAGTYTLYIRFANGGTSSRNISISNGTGTLVSDVEFVSTGSWTTWETKSVEIQLTAGYSELTFTSLTSEGMANIDLIGWNDANLYVGKVDTGSGNTQKLLNSKSLGKNAGDRYIVDFGRNGAGVYYIRNSKNERIRINGTRIVK